MKGQSVSVFLLLLFLSCEALKMGGKTHDSSVHNQGMPGGYSPLDKDNLSQDVQKVIQFLKQRVPQTEGAELVGVEQQVVAGMNFKFHFQKKTQRSETDWKIVVYRDLQENFSITDLSVISQGNGDYGKGFSRVHISSHKLTQEEKEQMKESFMKMEEEMKSQREQFEKQMKEALAEMKQQLKKVQRSDLKMQPFIFSEVMKNSEENGLDPETKSIMEQVIKEHVPNPEQSELKTTIEGRLSSQQQKILDDFNQKVDKAVEKVEQKKESLDEEKAKLVPISGQNNAVQPIQA